MQGTYMSNAKQSATNVASSNLENAILEGDLVTALGCPDAYPLDQCSHVEHVETHISHVFLTDRFAYKIKKRLRNDFLDYSSLERRLHNCMEEFRLDRRYAPDLYLGVVPISFADQAFRVDSGADSENRTTVEYAVKMRRFGAGALLSERLHNHAVTLSDMQSLARSLARFHDAAGCADPNSDFGNPANVRKDAFDNFDALKAGPHILDISERLLHLRLWTESEYERVQSVLAERKAQGFIRECHGDLHTSNIVRWKDAWMPFDGIEFNENFRFIDVLSDAGFLAMDLIAKHQIELSNLFVNFYLEETGDYQALRLLRWYMVYRALVRAKVSLMRLMQSAADTPQFASAKADLDHLLDTAQEIAQARPQCLWITHGLSGSGKSTGALRWVQDQGAIRIRSDVERKRMLGYQATDRPPDSSLTQVYSQETTNDVYCHLEKLASCVLNSGYSPVVDATFLEKRHRATFAALAEASGYDFQILDFKASESVLRARINSRKAQGMDPSDAGLEVLDQQIRGEEPLDAQEQEIACVVQA
jgi:uncharacterized protein